MHVGESGCVCGWKGVRVGECACGCCSPRHTEKENEGDIVFVPLSYQ